MPGRGGRNLVVAAATLIACAAVLVGPVDSAGPQTTAGRGLPVEALEQSGRTYAERGEYALARQAQERAVALRAEGDNPEALAAALDGLSLTLIRLESFDTAASSVSRARGIREQREGSDPLALAGTLQLDAMVQRYQGEYGAARATLDRAFNLLPSSGVPDGLAASLFQTSGDVAYLSGDMTRARTDFQLALDAAQRAYGPRSGAVVPFLRKLAGADAAFGNLAVTRERRELALSIAETAVPRCHPEAAAAMNDLALSEQYEGDYAAAQRLLERALERSRQCLGPSHSSTATKLHNLGNVLMDLGDLAQAERLQRQAAAAWSAGLGASHPYVALALESLAETLTADGRLDEAAALYQRALTIRTKKLGDDSGSAAWTLTSRAAVFARQRKLTLAIADLDRAAAIFDRVSTVDEPDHKAQMLALRGSVERARGNGEASRRAYAAAIAERERLFGPAHPLVAETRTLLAALDGEQGKTSRALDEALSAERIARDHLRSTIRFLPERQALDYAARKPAALDVAVAIAQTGGPETIVAVFDALVRSRGVVLEELAARTQMLSAPDHTAPHLAASVGAARQRYANLIVSSLRESVPRERLEAARVEAEEAERTIAERSVDARAERLRADAGLQEVLAALPINAALVAYVRYDPAKAALDSKAAPTYGAFVVAAGGGRSLAYVPIGTAARVDGLVRSWRAEVGTPPAGGPSDRPIVTAGAALRQVVWDPVVARLGQPSRIFVVADGALSLVSFAALPRPSGGFLVEDARVIHYLSTERDLLVAGESQRARSALIVGGAAFSGDRTRPAAAPVRAAVDCQNQHPLAFNDLPATRVEAAEVSSVWSQNGAGDVMVLSGAAATETAVKAALGGRRVIHLATHGFFLGSDCQPRQAGTRSVGGVVAATAPAVPVIRNPLLLSGLALAGANRQRSGSGDDGILTAQEIASLDLRGTEWAVLSACDTGLGEIRAGEGVLGLRRAFQIAGARTVIMSLWSVDDQATRRWMQALYEARLTRGLDTAASVRAASVAMLAQRRAQGLSTDPFYWAAFVAAGDWR